MFKGKYIGLFLATVIALMGLTVAAQAEDLPVTSPFGWRIHPISGEYSFHAGVDLGYDYGAAVPALFDGIVVLVSSDVDTIRDGSIAVCTDSLIKRVHELLEHDGFGFHFAEREYVGA